MPLGKTCLVTPTLSAFIRGYISKIRVHPWNPWLIRPHGGWLWPLFLSQERGNFIIGKIAVVV